MQIKSDHTNCNANNMGFGHGVEVVFRKPSQLNSRRSDGEGMGRVGMEGAKGRDEGRVGMEA